VTAARASDDSVRRKVVRAQIGFLFPALILLSSACGIGTGVAGILDAIGNMFFIPALIFCLLIPIGFSIGLGTLGLAASQGGRRAFYASWVLSGLMLLPTAGGLGIVVYDYPWYSISEMSRQMGWAEAVGWTLLAFCFVSLIGAFTTGLLIRRRL
jgi:hypothetical protein